ncbi:hypothetical protein ABZ802_31550 [Streptomyces sp. NPDC047737]|uniref:hypothetical protein n=1 Tax=Streptomyces sp. NPDC047737 TaxID=3155740 RepID=UPI0034050DBE
MNARENLLAAISFNDAANAGSTPEELVDAYRAEVLAQAADRFDAFDLRAEAAALRRMTTEEPTR